MTHFLLEQLEFGTLSLEQCRINSHLALLQDYSNNFWILVTSLIEDQEIFLIKEKNALKELYEEILPLLPADLVIRECDYNRLSDSEFERMCRDLLVEMGFENVKQRGHTNASDGGVDIEADLFIQTVLEKRIEHWIFQCKHTKSQVSRKDLGEVHDLLREFDAIRYGIFYSGTFTPQTIDRLKGLKAKHWGQADLDSLLRKYKNIAVRYFGI